MFILNLGENGRGKKAEGNKADERMTDGKRPKEKMKKIII